MTIEHPAVARFREIVSRDNVTTCSQDDDFAACVGVVDKAIYPALWGFVNEISGCRSYSGCKRALADYDRLVAAQQQTTEHPDIAAYRASVANGHATTKEDRAFVRAIMNDARVLDYLYSGEYLDNDLADFVKEILDDGNIGNGSGLLAAYDAIVGNTTPIAEQIDTANAKLGDSLNAMARTLDTLSEEFRRIADRL